MTHIRSYYIVRLFPAAVYNRLNCPVDVLKAIDKDLNNVIIIAPILTAMSERGLI